MYYTELSILAKCIALCILTCFPILIQAQLTGTVTRCYNEGGEVKIQGITTDPCISCYCMDGYVQCDKKKCDNLDGCHAILFDGPKRCCDTCKGCRLNGVKHESGKSWFDKRDRCTSYSCKAGVITKSKVQCHVPCSNPIKRKRQCCPSCKGCHFDGADRKNGEKFALASDPCVECKCRKGSVTCMKRACPVLNCPDEVIYQPKGECCPKCKGMRKIFDFPGACYFAKRVYVDGFSFEPKSETRCTCTKGTVICEKATCPPVACPVEERVQKGSCQVCEPKRNCLYDGKIHMHRSKWQPRMCTQCSCQNGVTYCQRERCNNSLSCPNGYKLQFQPGECCPKCVEHDAVCRVFGDPHYRTFDGKMYNFQGTCKYMLSQDCQGKDFTIKVKNGVRLSSGFAWTQMVVVLMGDTRISFRQNLLIKINRRRVQLPYTIPGKFSIRREGHSVTFRADIGLKVVWDGDSFLEVTASRKYKNRLCGLCGNYNGLETDDLIGRKGKNYLRGEEFGNSWRIGSKKACKTQPKVKNLQSICDKDFKAKVRANKECSVLYSRAFSSCRRVVDVTPYVTSCVTDMCDCPHGKKCSCESIQAYAHECKRAGHKVKWEKVSNCKAPQKNCPKGAYYSLCAPACPKTCSSNKPDGSCSKKCSPGCVCQNGAVLYKNRCISPEKCPKT
ncbi:hypothetical protein LOTGIDRAFT_168619 [Lottia gigantea]|uniref:VWFD domain-containing protein n=1 Tax=Lottia gigantea TaxID=225164 RepID=V3ZPW9_LOTGI|nr:hypothetical protein LOTGIDRAFT_168619 [Lottia gigantea]ESO84550.1 hypothetical protein LOTGIDRAFT_168619 [Lottia gigantea]